MGLVNSLFGSTNYGDEKWQGFQGKDLEVVIDLENPTDVTEVHLNCLQNTNSWIVFPKSMEVYTSLDGESFTKIAEIENTVPAEITTELIQDLNTKFETIRTRYIKVLAINYGSLPGWHSGAGEYSWLFVDEIIVK